MVHYNPLLKGLVEERGGAKRTWISGESKVRWGAVSVEHVVGHFELDPKLSPLFDARDSIREFVGAIEERVGHVSPATPFVAKKSADRAVSFLREAIESLIAQKIDLDVLVSRAAEAAQERIAAHEIPAVALNPSPGYQAAVDAGAAARTRMFKGADMLSSDRIAEILGVTRETINTRRKGGELLGLTHGGRIVRYPSWQLEGPVASAMPALMDIFKDFDPWAMYLFLTRSNPNLDGVIPLDLLRAGDMQSVVDAASIYAAEMA
ncbi:antitoxin Xre/MbcA/ParS toxin-binding domain-containing protein [Variovorax sp. J31P207]|uniref:antitoxin Xre/MbcA/ParS toxin-binding domain-containing protein n=1 Tax=Variovorax sp. J31P207 TaxID=3053510 RepID=UPI00257725D6|nr:antitoxin Xre/MbcA/ParS toxin-binding domain-containing protein [Variovorax sp. J31P207]MDM0067055.1 DUF2384 domain-containing protein [Variovorax sp. J31P207]